MIARWLLTLLLLLMPVGLTACAAESGGRPQGCASDVAPCLQGTAVVELETSRGRVRLQLDGGAAPLTAGNFVDLVNKGTYNGTVFHRVVREPVPFVVQGGDPQTANPKVSPTQYGMGNYLDPVSGQSRLIPLELRLSNESAPRYGQVLTAPGISRQLTLAHQRGAVAMARSGEPNSASAQFYIALQALPELDGRYAVFGRVIQGMEVVDAIQQGDKLVKATLLEGGTLVKGEP